MAEKLCPLFQSPCKTHDCHWYIQILGSHPQTGVQMNEWGCAVPFIALLQIETAKEVRQAAAAIESARNQASTDAAGVTGALIHAAKVRLGFRGE